ncbi:MAG: hypothetical protein M3140_00550 [Actinomycetota bacterium]|nr:hypothetical protein [Actinomycetota bacterium]
MNIDKEQILQLLRSQGQHDQADQASTELPDQVDTDNNDHAGLLSKFGLDPSALTSKLGGLGGLGGLGKLI